MRLWPALILLFVSSYSFARSNHYNLKVDIRPAAGEIQVSGDFTVLAVHEGMDALKFYLNKELNLEEASCALCRTPEFMKTRVGEYMFARDAAVLQVPLKRALRGGEAVTLHFRYGGKLPPTRESMITADWVELALYSAWFPFNPDLGRFTYELNITLDPAYRLAGAGAQKESAGGKWRLTQADPTFDIVMMAARDLQSKTIVGDHMRVQVASVGLDDQAASAMAAQAARITQQFAEWFGRATSPNLTVAVSRRKEGGGYSRPGLVCYSAGFIETVRNPAEMDRALAHEIAHLWWIGATPDSWQDCLNESFAEYSALMLVRDRQGEIAFAPLIASYGKNSKGAPALWGLDRNAKDAYRAFYVKGPYLLYGLEQTLGRERFRRWLAAIVHENLRTTDQVLAKLEQLSSREVRVQFEKTLKE